MKTLPSISILVMSYNQEAYIADCVDSVLSQEYDGELEFIFCDDNSSDSTFSIIQEKVRQYTGTRRIVAHKCPENGRVAVNMNTAVSLSQNDWLMRVDGDDILHPDRTRLSALAIMNDADAVAVSGQLKEFSSTPTPIKNPSDSDVVFKSYHHRQFTDRTKPDKLEWWGGVMTMSRRIFTEFGNMPAECDVLDDTMFGVRSLMLGNIVIIENAVLLYYRRHSTNVSSAVNHDASLSIRQLIRSDLASRDYYKRGVHCHQPILAELQTHSTLYPEYSTLYRYFKFLFSELQRQAFFWEKSWNERIADAHISGPFWKKIPWALKVMCPFTYALAAKLMKKS
ncbi:MAG: glycosyltransferase family 2 protein [Akkermansiaceae bacterium]|nr:glycosyltransferase family 2 protein [Akkermansiaceae bacterium]